MKNPKLNQIIAVQAGKKTRVKDTLTSVYHQLQKPDLLSGISRTYKPNQDGGEAQPSEYKNVQVSVGKVLELVSKELIDLFDVVATQDWGNCLAKADIVVNEKVLAAKVPVTYLLFIEKQLIDLRTLVSKLPTLDPADTWEFSPATDCYTSRVTQTNRTKKVPRNHIKYDATKEHPAQVEMYMEDVVMGVWDTIKHTGAIPSADKNAMLERVQVLQDAVKSAREEANSIEVAQQTVGEALVDYVLKG